MLTYTIVHDGVASDVTQHVQGTPELSWNAVGGCETATVRLDLPHTAFPGLGRRSTLVVTDRAARPIWYGYCKDPGQVSDDSGEAWDLGASGSMEAASLRVGRLVYADPDLGSWTRAKASVDSASVGQVDDDTLTGWRIGHPQGQAIGTGALAGIEYRQLARSDQGIGRVRATVTGHANDSGFTVIVATYTAGVVTDSISWPLAAGSTVLDLAAGDEITAGCDAVQIGIARAGGATNVTTDLAYIEVSGLTVEGSTLDRYGAPTTPGAPITSAAVVADLIGRGMLGPIDPDAAVIEDSGVVHTALSWATGIRGAAALEELREADPGMTWMYGTRGPGGLAFAWQAWGAGADAVRYDLTDQDTITASGTSELPGDRVLVIWTEDGTEHSLVVTDPETADDEYARDLDPISLGESTAAEAETAGREALTAAADAGRTITGVVNRQVLDRATGLMVEPWEVRPGCLARLEASGEVLRVQEVSYRDRDAGGLAELTLGAPPADLTSRMLRVIRGEVDPTAPLIPGPSQTPTPPTTRAPRPPELDDLEDQIEGVITTANGKNSATGATRAPTSSDPGVDGDLWYHFVGGNISGVYVHNGSGWVSRKLRDESIDALTVGKISGLDAEFLNAAITYLTSVTITSSTFQTALSGSRIVIAPQSPTTEMKLYYGSEDPPARVSNIGAHRVRIAVGVAAQGVIISANGTTIDGSMTSDSVYTVHVDTATLTATDRVITPGLVKTGQATVSAPAEDTNYTQAVSFGSAFPAAGPVPKVMLTLADVTGGTTRVKLAVSSVSRSGFTINLARTGGSTSMAVDWIAVAQ